MKKIFRYFFITLLLSIAMTVTCSAGSTRLEGRTLYCSGTLTYASIQGYVNSTGTVDKVIWEESTTEPARLHDDGYSNFVWDFYPKLEVNCSTFTLNMDFCRLTFRDTVTINGRLHATSTGGGSRGFAFNGTNNYIKEFSYGSLAGSYRSLNANIDTYWAGGPVSQQYSLGYGLGILSCNKIKFTSASANVSYTYYPQYLGYCTNFESSDTSSPVTVTLDLGNSGNYGKIGNVHIGPSNLTLSMYCINTSSTSAHQYYFRELNLPNTSFTGSGTLTFSSNTGQSAVQVTESTITVKDINCNLTLGNTTTQRFVLNCASITNNTISASSQLSCSTRTGSDTYTYTNYGGGKIICTGDINTTKLDTVNTSVSCKNLTAKNISFAGDPAIADVSISGTGYLPKLTVTGTCKGTSSTVFKNSIIAVTTLNSPSLTNTVQSNLEHNSRFKVTISNLTCTNFTGSHCFNSSNINITGAINCTHFCGKFDDNFKPTSFICAGPITATVPKDFQFPSSMSVNTTSNCTLTFTGDSALKGLAMQKVGNLIIKTSPVATKRVVTFYAASIGTGNIVNNVSTSSAEVVVDGGTLSWIITPILNF